MSVIVTASIIVILVDGRAQNIFGLACVGKKILFLGTLKILS